MKIKVLLILIIFLFLVSSVSASVTLRQGEVYEISNKELVVDSIRADKIKVNVDGIKNIVLIGEQKEINGVAILVESVFYVDQPEERTVSVVLSITFSCGDNNCDSDQGETKENCCEDCGCNIGFICSDDICKTEAQVEKEIQEEEEKSRDKCERDIDCNDNDPDTDDICKSTPGKPNMCLHMPPICKNDIECDDQDICTVDRCVNNDCFNAKVEDYIACLKKYEEIEIEEKAEESFEGKTSEILSDNELDKVIEKEKSFISKMFGFFLNLF